MTTIQDGLQIIIDATRTQGPVDTALIRTHATGILVALGDALPWRPIEELYADGKYDHDNDDPDGLLLIAPELVDKDCNTHGVGMGYWQDDVTWHMTQKDRSKDYGSWMACKWSITNDEWSHVRCTPTHYLRLRGVAR